MPTRNTNGRDAADRYIRQLTTGAPPASEDESDGRVFLQAITPGGVQEPGNRGIESGPSVPRPLVPNPTTPAPAADPAQDFAAPSTGTSSALAEAVSNFVNSSGRAGGQSDGPGAPESSRVTTPAPTPPQLVDKPASQLLTQKYKAAKG